MKRLKKYMSLSLTLALILSLAFTARADDSAAGKDTEAAAVEDTEADAGVSAQNSAVEDAISDVLDSLVTRLKDNPRRLIYTEGTDARILESAARLKSWMQAQPASVLL